MGRLLAVGTLAFDDIETPFATSGKILGGSATFIGLAAATFKVDTAVVSVVGEDFPQGYLDLLSERNINLDGVEIVKGGKTFYWAGRYHDNMISRDTLVTELNTLAQFNPIVPKDYLDAEVVVLGNLHPAIQIGVIDQMKVRPKAVILDTMNYWMDNELPLLKEVLTKIDVIALNDEEARQLTDEHSLVEAARKIMGMGPRYVVIKKGEHGALLFHEDEVFYAPAMPLKTVFDPTGAGDTFAGGLAGYLAATDKYSFEGLKTGLVHGANLASFCVEKFGTDRMVEISQEEIDDRLERFKRLTMFTL